MAIMGVVGALFLGGAGLTAAAAVKFISHSKTAAGIVTDVLIVIDSDGNKVKPVFTFTTDKGEEVTAKSGLRYRPGKYTTGEAVTVRYNSSAPSQARIDTFMESWLPTLILGGMGCVFLAVGLQYFVRQRLSAKRRQELLQTGHRVAARINGVVQETNYKINGRSPYVISIQWHDEALDGPRTGKSEHLWFNPEAYLNGRTELDVYVDPSNPKRYYADVSWLPKDNA